MLPVVAPTWFPYRSFRTLGDSRPFRLSGSSHFDLLLRRARRSYVKWAANRSDPEGADRRVRDARSPLRCSVEQIISAIAVSTFSPVVTDFKCIGAVYRQNPVSRSGCDSLLQRPEHSRTQLPGCPQSELLCRRIKTGVDPRFFHADGIGLRNADAPRRFSNKDYDPGVRRELAGHIASHSTTFYSGDTLQPARVLKQTGTHVTARSTSAYCPFVFR